MPLQCVTNDGRIWRKMTESETRSVGERHTQKRRTKHGPLERENTVLDSPVLAV